ncbi:TATA element modulatory factor [Atheta coriaria]|uniref:TATA element modulatory factor n=1 Tax=Dalotia coriaria TaxID=877792 RepID=UPI0031F3F81D
MSWFDTAGFANIAKTALKEAQRTIDKALDIKEESIVPPANTPIDTNSDDFFGSWGVSPTDAKEENTSLVTSSPSKIKQPSIWGSFTGSFFDPYSTIKEPSYNIQARDSVDSLDDSVGVEHFRESKLVVHPADESIDGDSYLSPGGELKRSSSVPVGGSDNEQKSPESIEVITSSALTTPDSELLSSNSVTQITTESIEILQNSVTSPSSIEVLSLKAHHLLHQRMKSVLATPDSIEVIPEDIEEPSITDDSVSLNSPSECTQNTAYENVNAPVKHKLLTHTESAFGEPSTSSDAPITRAPSRCGMHLPLQHIQVPNVIDIPQDLQITSISEADESTYSDRTMVGSDNVMESSSDTSTTTDSNTSSLYLKNMIADAMTEKRSDTEPHYMDLKQTMLGESTGPNMLQNLSISQLDMPPRETSPISSESRSDLVKVGSDQTSGHTSGDEIETTTSSDIEIISSPNGDSSSTQSRHSPAKITGGKSKGDSHIEGFLGKINMKKIMGHHRELSETSNISDDSENDRLIKRLAEVTEILEIRENKLIETSRKLSEVQELNSDLQKQLDIAMNKQVQSADISEVTEKYAQRLSALEKKFQQAIRDKDLMRKQLDQCREDNAVRMSKSEIDGVMEEKDQIIKELREEGGKLSKQQLQHSNIIKKLRAKEKENENTIKYLKDSVEDFSSETERLKRSLSAKEEVERSQIEAIHQLTAKTKKLEYEYSQVQGNYDDLVQKHDTVKKSLDAAKKELIDKNKASSELQQREQLLESLENSKKMTESQNQEIINQLEDLRLKMREGDQELLGKEQKFRLENAELMRRLENAESRNEELSQSLLEASKPLVRQLEALQAMHNMKVSSFEKTEQSLTMRINELQNKLHNVMESSRGAKEECLLYKNKLSSLQVDVESLTRENDQLKVQIDQAKTDLMLREQTYNKEVETLKETVTNQNESIANLQKLVDGLQYNIDVERNNHEKEKRKIQETFQHDHPKEKLEKTSSVTRTSPIEYANAGGNQSPTPSVGRVSVCESMSSSLWPEENIELSTLSRCTNILEMQFLTTNLKQRDGDIQQLQWELNRRENERTLLNTEISQLLTRVEDLSAKTNKLEEIEKELTELRQQYETLCQLYGEKVEENDELKLDLIDIKEMYKAQIDELLLQQKRAT